MTYFFRLGKNINANLGKYASCSIFFGLVIGNLFQVQWMKMLIPLALFMMLVPAMLNTEIEKIKESIVHPGLLTAALVFTMLISPLLMFGITEMLPADNPDHIFIGLLLFSLVPGAGISTAYTNMLNGNVSLCVTVVAGSFLLSLITIPFLAELLIGKYVVVSAWIIVKYLIMLILIPMIASTILRVLIVKKKGRATFEKIKNRFRDTTGYGFILMVTILISLNASMILKNPTIILKVMIPVICFFMALFFLILAYCKIFKIGYEDTIALAMSGSGRNVAIAVTIALTAFDEASAMIATISGPLVQLPTMLLFMRITQMITKKKNSALKHKN